MDFTDVVNVIYVPIAGLVLLYGAISKRVSSANSQRVIEEAALEETEVEESNVNEQEKEEKLLSLKLTALENAMIPSFAAETAQAKKLLAEAQAKIEDLKDAVIASGRETGSLADLFEAFVNIRDYFESDKQRAAKSPEDMSTHVLTAIRELRGNLDVKDASSVTQESIRIPIWTWLFAVACFSPLILTKGGAIFGIFCGLLLPALLMVTPAKGMKTPEKLAWSILIPAVGWAVIGLIYLITVA